MSTAKHDARRLGELEAELAEQRRLLAALERDGMKPMIAAIRRKFSDEDRLSTFRAIARSGDAAAIVEALRQASAWDAERWFRDLDHGDAIAVLHRVVVRGDTEIEAKIRGTWDGFRDLAAEVAAQAVPEEQLPRHMRVGSTSRGWIELGAVTVHGADGARAYEALTAAGWQTEDVSGERAGNAGRVALPVEERSYWIAPIRVEGQQYAGRHNDDNVYRDGSTVMTEEAWIALRDYHPQVPEFLARREIAAEAMPMEYNRKELGRRMRILAREGHDVLAAIRGTRKPEPAPAPEASAAAPEAPARARLRVTAAVSRPDSTSPQSGEDRAVSRGDDCQ